MKHLAACAGVLSVPLLVISSVGASATDPALQNRIPLTGTSSSERQTLTGDWFGHGVAMREAGFDFRLEWSQFYQGLTSGLGDKSWQYGGKWDALVRFDLSRIGLWNGLGLTVQGAVNYGETVNGFGGALIPVNAALYFPGIRGADASDLMALYVTQNFGSLVTLNVGKLNLVEVSRGRPLRGGGGVDTFWNVNLATPITGLSPPTINGAQVIIKTQPVSFSLTVFDPLDATNRPLFSDLFDAGVSVMGTATYSTAIAGLRGSYGIKGIYSTRRGSDLSEVIQPPGLPGPILDKSGSWYGAFSFQQYLVQDSANPARGWGVFGEVARSDGNPNTLDWSIYFGVGGSSPIPGRLHDRFGVAYFRYGASNVLKTRLAPVFRLRDESGIEFFYNFAVTPWFRLAGNLQFIRPATEAAPDAIYAGVSSYVRF